MHIPKSVGDSALPRAIAATAVILIVALLTQACSSSPATAPPTWPSGVEHPPENPFGDVVSARSQDAWGPVFDILATEFGRENLNVAHLAVTAAIDSESIRRDVDRQMIDQRGWRSIEQPPAPPADAWSHGYESPGRKDIFILIGLHPRPGDTLVPLNVVTTLPIP